MKQFACGDVVPGCTRRFEGSADQILSAVAEHAQNDHGLTTLSAGLVAQVHSYIRAA